jgi:two-component system cell cycle response regulator DivK
MMATARILVVEDNALNMKLVRDVLTVSGYEVVAAPSGEEGVSLAQTCAPDLVLMDIQLPGIDGYEALRMLRQNPMLDGVPVVAVTAFAMREDQERTWQAGFDGYLGKPINVPSLSAQVQGFLSNGRSHAS